MSWILRRMGKGKEIKIKKDELGQGENFRRKHLIQLAESLKTNNVLLLF